MIEDLWYKNAVVYCLDVETFMDGNGDGVGDFRGLKRRLDYLAGLGVTCVWLLPFQPSPNRDNGYDITDYYGVDARLGDLGDFVAFTHQAKPLWPWASVHGWKWSELSAAVKPASCARRTRRSSSLGGNCSWEAW